MKKVNVPTKQMSKFPGKWIAIDTIKNKIIAVSNTPEGITPVVTMPINTPSNQVPSAFKVPYKNEDPYIFSHSFI